MLKSTEKETQATQACPVCGRQIQEDQRCCPECEVAYLRLLAS
ncbi:hypothetical protein [Pseudoflavonifractor phocaeensis]|nr:hypothetical protein [Pseudoflavonifractor phocaeensis]